MNKLLLVALCVLIAIGAVFALPLNKQVKNEMKGDNIMKDKKILIAYFSWGGNTKSIAEKINAKVGGDMFRIETKTPYPTDYNETAYGVAKKQHDENIHPELKNNGDVSGYDVVFVGTPAWWYTMAPAVATFLENNDFKGKTIIPFITHGGGGKYNIAGDMAKLAPDAKVLEPIAIYERGNAETDKQITDWLNKF